MVNQSGYEFKKGKSRSGSCIDPNSGSVNENKLKENLSMVIDAYISRVDNCLALWRCQYSPLKRCRIQSEH